MAESTVMEVSTQPILTINQEAETIKSSLRKAKNEGREDPTKPQKLARLGLLAFANGEPEDAERYASDTLKVVGDPKQLTEEQRDRKIAATDAHVLLGVIEAARQLEKENPDFATMETHFTDAYTFTKHQPTVQMFALPLSHLEKMAKELEKRTQLSPDEKIYQSQLEVAIAYQRYEEKSKKPKDITAEQTHYVRPLTEAEKEESLRMLYENQATLSQTESRVCNEIWHSFSQKEPQARDDALAYFAFNLDTSPEGIHRIRLKDEYYKIREVTDDPTIAHRLDGTTIVLESTETVAPEPVKMLLRDFIAQLRESGRSVTKPFAETMTLQNAEKMIGRQLYPNERLYLLHHNNPQEFTNINEIAKRLHRVDDTLTSHEWFTLTYGEYVHPTGDQETTVPQKRVPVDLETYLNSLQPTSQERITLFEYLSTTQMPPEERSRIFTAANTFIDNLAKYYDMTEQKASLLFGDLFNWLGREHTDQLDENLREGIAKVFRTKYAHVEPNRDFTPEEVEIINIITRFVQSHNQNIYTEIPTHYYQALLDAYKTINPTTFYNDESKGPRTRELEAIRDGVLPPPNAPISPPVGFTEPIPPETVDSSTQTPDELTATNRHNERPGLFGWRNWFTRGQEKTPRQRKPKRVSKQQAEHAAIDTFLSKLWDATEDDLVFGPRETTRPPQSDLSASAPKPRPEPAGKDETENALDLNEASTETAISEERKIEIPTNPDQLKEWREGIAQALQDTNIMYYQNVNPEYFAPDPNDESNKLASFISFTPGDRRLKFLEGHGISNADADQMTVLSDLAEANGVKPPYDDKLFVAASTSGPNNYKIEIAYFNAGPITWQISFKHETSYTKFLQYLQSSPDVTLQMTLLRTQDYFDSKGEYPSENTQSYNNATDKRILDNARNSHLISETGKVIKQEGRPDTFVFVWSRSTEQAQTVPTQTQHVVPTSSNDLWAELNTRDRGELTPEAEELLRNLSHQINNNDFLPEEIALVQALATVYDPDKRTTAITRIAANMNRTSTNHVHKNVFDISGANMELKTVAFDENKQRYMLTLEDESKISHEMSLDDFLTRITLPPDYI